MFIWNNCCYVLHNFLCRYPISFFTAREKSVSEMFLSFSAIASLIEPTLAKRSPLSSIFNVGNGKGLKSYRNFITIAIPVLILEWLSQNIWDALCTLRRHMARWETHTIDTRGTGKEGRRGVSYYAFLIRDWIKRDKAILAGGSGWERYKARR